jgi:hypothetical protein
MVFILWNLSSPKPIARKLKKSKNLQRIDKELWKLVNYRSSFTFFKYSKPELVDSYVLKYMELASFFILIF